MMIKLKTHLYYYVPPCPRCGSRKTGRFIRTPFTDGASVIKDGLKKGELIRFIPRITENNAYCVTCGHEFYAKTETRWLDAKELYEEQRARGTDELYRKLVEQQKAQMPPQKGIMGMIQWLISKNPKNNNELSTAAASPAFVPDTLAPAVIDSRPRDTIEILYANTALMKQALEEII